MKARSCFQWEESNFNLDDVKDELADVINYCIQMSQVLNLDIYEIVMNKLEKTRKKYPVDKCKSKATKYNKL